MKLCANLGWLFKETPFLERFALAAKAGFEAVELSFDQYEHTPEEVLGAQVLMSSSCTGVLLLYSCNVQVQQALDGAGLSCQLLNTPKGDWDAGDRGLASVPGRVHSSVKVMSSR